jgi:hypothetical protein
LIFPYCASYAGLWLLHDGLGQELAAIAYRIKALIRDELAHSDSVLIPENTLQSFLGLAAVNSARRPPILQTKMDGLSDATPTATVFLSGSPLESLRRLHLPSIGR